MALNREVFEEGLDRRLEFRIQPIYLYSLMLLTYSVDIFFHFAPFATPVGWGCRSLHTDRISSLFQQTFPSPRTDVCSYDGSPTSLEKCCREKKTSVNICSTGKSLVVFVFKEAHQTHFYLLHLPMMSCNI